MNRDLTQGPITGQLIRFALPLMAGNLLQQLYNVVDTLIVGRCLGADALAAVGSAYSLMTFLTSVLLGLCMGAGAFFAMQYGRRDMERLRQGAAMALTLIGALAAVMMAAAYALLGTILHLLQVPAAVAPLMAAYLRWIFAGILATFLYNFAANLLRSVGNSVAPLIFLAVSAVMNIALDLLFVLGFGWGVAGAAAATVAAQYISGVGLCVYWVRSSPELMPRRRHFRFERPLLRELSGLSLLTSVQQSVMNFGILMVQGLVNSFGATVMAAFAAAVKIDALAYMPVQDFGNAFSTFVAQNHGAGQQGRIRRGILVAVGCVAAFCAVISPAVCILAERLMGVFVDPALTDIVAQGAAYLRIEGACYIGIGVLFLLYGYYRAVGKPGMSVVLTVLSLGTRVALAYLLSGMPEIGVTGIWAAIPIGWALADAVGIAYGAWTQRRDKRKAGMG